MKKWIAVLLTLALLIAAVPLTAAYADGSEVYVVADGVAYRMQKGDTFEYVYYLNMGEDKLCSLQGELHYGAAGLTMAHDDELEMVFPQVSPMAKITEPGFVKYNYSNVRGKNLSAGDDELIRAAFTVAAHYGVYEITNSLHTVAGKKEHVYISSGKVVDPVQRAESTLIDREPYTGEIPSEFPPEPTEPTDPDDPENPTDPSQPDEIRITTVDADDYPYVIAEPDDFTLFRAELTHVGEVITTDERLRVTIPADEAAILYVAEHTTPSDLHPEPVEALYTDGSLTFDADTDQVYILSESGEEPRLLLHGDADGDNTISIVDVSCIQRDLAGIEKLDELHKRIANADDDDMMTIIDGTCIQQWLADIPSPLDCYPYPKKQPNPVSASR